MPVEAEAGLSSLVPDDQDAQSLPLCAVHHRMGKGMARVGATAKGRWRAKSGVADQKP
jgi:hypothetical protein